MRRAVLLIVLCAGVVATSLAADDPTTSVRVFNLRNATVLEVFTAIEPVLSRQGSVTIQPARNRLTVQDEPRVVERVSQLISELDDLRGEYRIEVELLEGLESGEYTDLSPELDRRLHRMFPFKAYRKAGRAMFQGVLGEPTAAPLGGSYRLSFLADTFKVPESTPWGVADVGDRTQVKWLRLERFVSGPNGQERVVELLRTTVFLSPRQRMIIGAGSSEDSDSGLVLILTMHSVEDS